MSENPYDDAERKMKAGMLAEIYAKQKRDRISDAGWICAVLGTGFPFVPHAIGLSVCALAFGVVSVCRDNFAKGLSIILLTIFCSALGTSLAIHALGRSIDENMFNRKLKMLGVSGEVAAEKVSANFDTLPQPQRIRK